jgi:hypothetical protein
MKKLNKETLPYILTFLFTLIAGIIGMSMDFFKDNSAFLIPICMLPLIVTNAFMPLMLLSLGGVKHKWQILFFFIVPYSTMTFIFFDGIPSAFEHFKDKWNNLK